MVMFLNPISFFFFYMWYLIISLPFFPLFFVELESHGKKEKKEEIHYAYVNGVVYNVPSFILPWNIKFVTKWMYCTSQCHWRLLLNLIKMKVMHHNVHLHNLTLWKYIYIGSCKCFKKYMQSHGTIEKLKICSIKSVKCMNFRF